MFGETTDIVVVQAKEGRGFVDSLVKMVLMVILTVNVDISVQW